MFVEKLTPSIEITVFDRFENAMAELLDALQAVGDARMIHALLHLHRLILIDEHFAHPEAGAQRLMELLGHTPLEVLVGALLGVASALIWTKIT